MMMPKSFKDIHRWTNMIDLAVKECKSLALVKPGDGLVVTAGIPLGESNGINSIRLVTV
jgi:pyruvate kinase